MKSWCGLFLWGAFFLEPGIGQSQDWSFNKNDSTYQDVPPFRFLQLRYQFGGIANTNTPGIAYIDRNPFQSLDFRYGVQALGGKGWHQLHHFPSYGLGIGKYFFQPADNILGSPLTTYLFFKEPFIRFKKSTISYDFAMGLAFPWKAYDAQTNPDQLVIGSVVTGYLGFGVEYDFKISNRIEGIAGISLSHFSNGRIRSPNRGLNLYGLNVSVRYRLGAGEEQHTYTRSMAPFKPFTEFYGVVSGGVVTTFQDKDNPSIYYMAGSVSMDAARHYGYKGKYGIGLDWFYDESLKVTYQSDYPGGVPDHLLYWPGVHLSHEYMIHRWTFITQAGVNLTTVADKGVWYGRIAFRYDLSEHLFVRIGIRTYKTVISDFMEWGLGYSWYRIRK